VQIKWKSKLFSKKSSVSAPAQKKEEELPTVVIEKDAAGKAPEPVDDVSAVEASKESVTAVVEPVQAKKESEQPFAAVAKAAPKPVAPVVAKAAPKAAPKTVVVPKQAPQPLPLSELDTDKFSTSLVAEKRSEIEPEGIALREVPVAPVAAEETTTIDTLRAQQAISKTFISMLRTEVRHPLCCLIKA
jgi:hypothetical protein